MGDTIWLDVEGRSESDLPQDNSIMLRLKENLDDVSKKIGVASIGSFFDYSALEENYAEFLPDPEAQASEKPSGRWFDPAAVLRVIKPLRAHLQTNPSDLVFESDNSNARWRSQLIDELKHCEQVLEEAVSKGRKVRFLIVA